MELKFDVKKPDYEYITDKKAAVNALNALSSEKVIAVDVEASSLDPYLGTLFLVQIGTPTKAYLFDARKVDLKKIPEYKKLLENEQVIKILHNSTFDYKYLKVQTGVEMNNIYDTMLAEAVLTSGLKKRVGLLHTINRRLGEGLVEKETQGSFVDLPKSSRLTQIQKIYSAKDVLLLFPLFESQLKDLKKENLVKIAKLEFATAPVVAEMELSGIYIDKKHWMQIIDALKIKRNELAQEFQDTIRQYYETSQTDLFGNKADVININSQVQLMELFNDKLGLDMPSTGSAVLSQTNHPVVNMLSKYRGYEKLISAFGDSIISKIHPVTKRIHPEFHQMRTATGRFACQNPNIQQIPRNSEEAPFRECVNPEPGYKLVVSDYSQFEMRVLAELSGDENLRKAYTDKLDLHSYTAALMFDKPYSADFKKKFPEFRQMAKPLNFGIMYGLSPIGLSRQMQVYGKELSVDESEDMIKKYFKGYPGVKRYLERQSKSVLRQGFSTTPAGRKRWYVMPEKTDPDYRRKMSGIQNAAKNHPIQGTNADAIKYALVFVHKRMKEEGIDGKIILTVHDEIACEVKEDQAEYFAQMLSDEMVKAAEMFIKSVPVVSDPFVGDVWEH